MADTTPLLDILYQDDVLVAIRKPAGLLVHKSPIDKHETRYAMKYLRDQLGQWVYPIHRLDKPTSGLLLFALDPESASQVSQQFEQRNVSKAYCALVRGWPQDSGVICHALKEIAVFKDQRKQVEALAPKDAETRYEVAQRYELPFPDGRFESSRYSLLRVFPKTGRKHQIRRHLKHISYPIVGDVKYGKGPHNRLFREHFDTPRLLLAATELKLTHPLTGETMVVSCPLCEDFQTLLDRIAPYHQAQDSSS